MYVFLWEENYLHIAENDILMTIFDSYIVCANHIKGLISINSTKTKL